MFGTTIEGIGMAISINDVKVHIDRLRDGAIVRLPWQNYSNRWYGYSIDYPPGWVVNEDTREFTYIDGGGFTSVSIQVYDLEGITEP